MQPISMNELELFCRHKTPGKNQILACDASGDFQTAGKARWWHYFRVSKAPQKVTAMVSQYNLYLKRQQEIEARAIDTPIRNRKIKPISWAYQCQVKRVEKDISLLKGSPAYLVHEAEIALEKYLLNKTAPESDRTIVTLLAADLIDSAFKLFAGNDEKIQAYYQEKLDQLQHCKPDFNQTDMECLQELLLQPEQVTIAKFPVSDPDEGFSEPGPPVTEEVDRITAETSGVAINLEERLQTDSRERHFSTFSEDYFPENEGTPPPQGLAERANSIEPPPCTER